jgi:hypothetical protein
MRVGIRFWETGFQQRTLKRLRIDFADLRPTSSRCNLVALEAQKILAGGFITG